MMKEYDEKITKKTCHRQVFSLPKYDLRESIRLITKEGSNPLTSSSVRAVQLPGD